MREIFTDKNFIAQKKIFAVKLFLIVALIIFFLPLIVLPFFNHACADDYICGYNLQEKGFWGYQFFIYEKWGGRFSATFTGSLFAVNNYLYDHYYLHSLLLLLMNFLSIFFLLSVVSTHLLKDNLLRKYTLLLSLLFLALTVCVYPQTSTFFFWFSSAITYHLPIILMQIEMGLLILIFHTSKKNIRTVCMFLMPFFFFVITGFNELFIVVQFFLLAVILFFKLYTKSSKVFLLVLFLAFLTSAMIMIFAPGNWQRATIVAPKPIYIALISSSFHAAETLWSIFKSPIFWFAAVIIFFYGNQSKQKFGEYGFIKTFRKKQWLLPFVILFFLFGCVAIAVAGLKGGIIPDRYLNDVTYCTLLLLLVYAFFAGVLAPTALINSFISYRKLTIIYGLLAIGLLCNVFISSAYKSIISAPLYNLIMNEREEALKEGASKKNPVTVSDYNKAMLEHLQRDYQNSTTTLRELIQQKPSLFFPEDDLASAYSIDILKNFYRLDSIIVKRN